MARLDHLLQGVEVVEGGEAPAALDEGADAAAQVDGAGHVLQILGRGRADARSRSPRRAPPGSPRYARAGRR